jgi:hypothetical protein
VARCGKGRANITRHPGHNARARRRSPPPGLTLAHEDILRDDSPLLLEAQSLPTEENRWSARSTANVLHPGVVATNFGKSAGPMWRAMFTVLAPVSLSAEKGAQTAIYLASSPEVATVTGQYFIKCKPARSSEASYDVAAQQRLWAISEQLTGLTAPALGG